MDLETFTGIALRRRARKSGDRLPGRYHFLPRLPRWGRRPPLALRALQTALNVGLAVLAGAVAGRAARRRRADWVVSVADEGFSPIAGAVAARLGGARHVLWVFDPWEENAYSDAERWVASRLERRIWRGAAAVLVHAEQMAEHYERKHGVRCHVLATPVELDGRPAGPPPADPGRPREVLVAGAVYWLQEEAVRRLGEVCRGLPDVRLTIQSGLDLLRARDLEADGREPYLPLEEYRARLAGADVLFVGLSFDSDAPLAVRTSAPARLPEYMASGTPILVHAPAGSHVAEYVRREGFAALVDRPDPAALEAALRDVIEDRDGALARAARARELAEERHEAGRVAERIAGILEGVRCASS